MIRSAGARVALAAARGGRDLARFGRLDVAANCAGVSGATRGIRINALCAGVTATAAMRAAKTSFPQLVADLIALHPMVRMATEDEIAGAALWLCSDGASYLAA